QAAEEVASFGSPILFVMGSCWVTRGQCGRGSVRQRLSGRGLREQLWDADQVVSCDRKGEHRRGFGKSSNLDLAEPGLCLDPAEHLLDPLAQDLADPITRMPGGAAIDCGLAHHA